ncbi:MAG: hypothetical protein ACR2QR_06910, partial [Woeseiaceae bacterium]
VEMKLPPANERVVDAIVDIVGCIENKSQPKSSGRTSLSSLRIIDGIRRSAKNGNARVTILASPEK